MFRARTRWSIRTPVTLPHISDFYAKSLAGEQKERRGRLEIGSLRNCPISHLVRAPARPSNVPVISKKAMCSYVRS